MPEIVSDCGYICEYGDVNSATISIMKALDSEESLNAEKRIRSMFSLNQREEKLVKAITEKL
jgi:hypothetical protein